MGVIFDLKLQDAIITASNGKFKWVVFIVKDDGWVLCRRFRESYYFHIGQF